MALPDYTSLVAGSGRTTGFINAVINNGGAMTGDEIDNVSFLDEILDCEIEWRYNTAPTPNRTVEVWLLYSFDGTNYTTRESGGGILLRAFSPHPDMNTYRIPILGVPLMPFKFKLQVRNVDTGQPIIVTVNAQTRKATQLIE
jgi:hypothetical protein